jgi:hypothetical protein
MNLLVQETSPTSDDTRLIPLTQGKFATVDAADFEWLSEFNWYALKTRHTFYAARKITVDGSKHTILMHREILAAPKGINGDHWDCDGLNNRRFNLRIATVRQNACNSRTRSDSTCGFKGVYWEKRYLKWAAQIHFEGHHYHIGYFLSAENAAIAYNIAALEHFGSFARLNIASHSK